MSLGPRGAKRAHVLSKPEFILLETISGWYSVYWDYKRPRLYLPQDISDERLGVALRDTMSHSRVVSPADDPDLFDDAKADQRFDAYVRELMDRFGYASGREALKELLHCSVELVDDQISIRPSRQFAPSLWQGLGPDSWILLAADCSASELGKGLRLAIGRCRGLDLDALLSKIR
jgi:hypothetical protein